MGPVPAGLTVEKEILTTERVVILHFAGDLDAHTSKQALTVMDELANARYTKFVVDLTKVNYMSSAGASLFINVQGEVQESGGDLILMNPTSAVLYVLKLLGLLLQFRVVNTREEALAALKAPPANSKH